MTDIIIAYDHAMRELENNILLKIELEKRGYSVEVMPLFAKGPQWKHYRFSHPKAILVPWGYMPFESNFVLKYRYHPSVVINLQVEQLIPSDTYTMPWLEGAGLFMGFCAWGEGSRRMSAEAGLVADSRLTGHPTRDFYRKELAPYYKSKDELASALNLNPNIPWILYIASFCTDPEAYPESLFHNPGEREQLISFHTESALATARLLDGFLATSPKVLYIYRPHPGTHVLEEIEELQRKYHNFRIISNYNIRQWINAADRINLWMSTAALDAYWSGKPTYIIRPLTVPKAYDQIVYFDCTTIEATDDFIRVNTPESEQRGMFPIAQERIEAISGTTTKPTYAILADFVDDMLAHPDASSFEKAYQAASDTGALDHIYGNTAAFIGFYQELRSIIGLDAADKVSLLFGRGRSTKVFMETEANMKGLSAYDDAISSLYSIMGSTPRSPDTLLTAPLRALLEQDITVDGAQNLRNHYAALNMADNERDFCDVVLRCVYTLLQIQRQDRPFTTAAESVRDCIDIILDIMQINPLPEDQTYKLIHLISPYTEQVLTGILCLLADVPMNEDHPLSSYEAWIDRALRDRTLFVYGAGYWGERLVNGLMDYGLSVCRLWDKAAAKCAPVRGIPVEVPVWDDIPRDAIVLFALGGALTDDLIDLVHTCHERNIASFDAIALANWLFFNMHHGS